MRTDAVLVSALYSALLLGGVHAQASEASEATESSTTVIEKPVFTPTTLKADFLEQFTEDWDSRWIPSKAKKDDPKTDEDWAYVGEWAVEEPHKFRGIEGDKGLVVKSAAAHHAISAKFPKKIDNKGKTLVAQYEVKLQNDLQCGGAYMKLLQDNKKLHAEEFSNSSPYVIMFGPDKCGTTNKVHFIFRHKNPKTGEYEEKHMKSPPVAKLGSLTNLYTLIVNPDQSFQIRINGEAVKNGTLLEDFTPPVNPEKEIDDPKDEKPDTWVDEARIPDPEATKPEDWDEDAPFEIPDEDAEKPEDWLEDEPLTIPDPEAPKPEDWDDEEDGDWIPPSIQNPKCEEVSGCGKWERPSKKNPAYKGKWTAPMIDNPAYKGVWAPRKIKNPAYFEDKTPSNLEPMGAIGFEIWTMQNDILFDNIYIGHSVEDAEKLKAETFDVKRPLEEAEKEKSEPEKPKATEPVGEKNFMDDPVAYATEKFTLFLELAQKDPVTAVQTVPEVAGVLGLLLATVLSLILTAVTNMGGAGTTAPPQAKKAADKVTKATKDAKDSVVDAATSGAEKVQTEVNKRATRSSGASQE